MLNNVYSRISKQTGVDARIVRAAAHHPFKFFSEVMMDPNNHRPVRFRYLGAFFVKPYWHKGLKKTSKVGYPAEGDNVWARVPEQKYNKTYINLKEGTIKGTEFVSNSENYSCPTSDIQFWTKVN